VEPFVIASFFMASPIKDGTMPLFIGVGGAGGAGGGGADGTLGTGGAEGNTDTGICVGGYIIILLRNACCSFTRLVSVSIVSLFILYIYVPGISSGLLASMIGIHSLFTR